jgi:hypothetical protein
MFDAEDARNDWCAPGAQRLAQKLKGLKAAVVLPAQIREAMPSFDQTPDQPQPFGYKISWFAVKASDPAAVLNALEVGAATPTNWASGIAAAYGDDWVFVSPPISGWVLVVGSSLPYPTNETHHDIGSRFDQLFSRLMTRFDDVQFFGSHRVVGFVTWARALAGKPVRIFAYADEVMANVGEQTAEAAKLGFANLGGLSPSDALDEMFRIADEQHAEEEALVATGLSRREARAKVLQGARDAIPDETDVVEFAGLWSIDPIVLDHQDHPLGLGLAARLPENLKQ